MINIDDAIESAKELDNVSVGGSACYDFGNVVLVKYTLPLKYVKTGYRAREKQEIVMKGINEKVAMGVNTPRHLDMKRVVEGENDVCYVLQEKCRGKCCGLMSKYGAPIERVLSESMFVSLIPFEHYRKLIADACILYEMGYEAKNKNLFYDEKTGFWFIDFLDNREDNKFDFNDPRKIFRTIKYVCPKPIQIASCLSYNTVISDEDRKKLDDFVWSSKAKFLLACKKEIPIFNRYEFFYLLDEKDNYKKYLNDKGYVSHDLFNASEEDYEIYRELFSFIVNGICHEIALEGKEYWDVEVNSIRNESDLFSLVSFYEKYVCKDIKKEDYEDEYDYDYAVRESYTNNMMSAIYNTLLLMKMNDNISKFIAEYKVRKGSNSFKK